MYHVLLVGIMMIMVVIMWAMICLFDGEACTTTSSNHQKTAKHQEIVDHH